MTSLDDFIGAAQAIGLTKTEHAGGRATLLARIAADVGAGATGLSLTPRERDEMRAAIRAFAAARPVREGCLARLRAGLLHRSLAAATAAVVLVAGTGASAYAAESALPGDALYPLKIGLNEPFIELFTLRAEAKLQWKLRRLERRFEEAEALLVAGRIDPTTWTVMESSFEQRRAELSAALDASPEDDTAAAGIAAETEEILEARADRIERLLTAGRRGAAPDAFIKRMRGSASKQMTNFRRRARALPQETREKIRDDVRVRVEAITETVEVEVQTPSGASSSVTTEEARSSRKEKRDEVREEIREIKHDVRDAVREAREEGANDRHVGDLLQPRAR